MVHFLLMVWKGTNSEGSEILRSGAEVSHALFTSKNSPLNQDTYVSFPFLIQKFFNYSCKTKYKYNI